jgi:hypothetical protein
MVSSASVSVLGSLSTCTTTTLFSSVLPFNEVFGRFRPRVPDSLTKTIPSQNLKSQMYMGKVSFHTILYEAGIKTAI